VTEYGVLTGRQRSDDKLTPVQLGKPLAATGVVMSGTAFSP
jgi:hypothetical protein